MHQRTFAPAEQPADFKLNLQQPAHVIDLTLQPAARRAPTFTETLARAVAQLEDLVTAADAHLASGGAQIDTDSLCRELDRSRAVLGEVFGGGR